MANTMAALLRASRPIASQSFLEQTKNIIFKSQGFRHLYSQASLGMDSYLQQKSRTITQLSNIAPKFREKMRDYTADESKNMVFTEDLKNMLHIAESEDDLQLAVKMMKRFNQQNKQLRFGNYIFGPVVMRMFYFLDKPKEAYECFKSPEMEGFFDQLVTYQILLDMLYEHKMYNDILEAFQIIKDKQIEGIKFAKNVIVLALAACYKLNTKESLEYALKLWAELHEIGHLPMRRATTFCAGLALKQNKPDVALEIISIARNANYTTVRNIKVAALVAMGRVEDAIPVLKGILLEDSAAAGPVQTFNRDIVDQAKAAVEKLDNADIKLEFTRIEKYFQEQGHISDSSLDEQLCQEIATAAGSIRQPKFNRFQRNSESNWSSRDRDSNWAGGDQDSNWKSRDREPRQFNRDRRFGGRVQRPGLADL